MAVSELDGQVDSLKLNPEPPSFFFRIVFKGFLSDDFTTVVVMVMEAFFLGFFSDFDLKNPLPVSKNDGEDASPNDLAASDTLEPERPSH